MLVYQIGNLGPGAASFSTENDLRRSLESMGHEVIATPERNWNNASAIATIEHRRPAFVLWTTTPAYAIPPDQARVFIATCRELGIPTVGLHLDLWRGLQERAPGFNSHPYFTIDLLCTPDGSEAAEAEWKRRGINHLWSPPGILESSCYLAEPDPAHVLDVIFVGAKGYHGEHPRGQLIDFLSRRYGSRFKLYEHGSGMREHKLNVLYASARVVAGDSCFAGRPGFERYWSDRLPETVGRGGRLVFPYIDGLPDDLQCRTYRAGDYEDMARVIDEALGASDATALQERQCAVAWARAGQTYRHRLTRIIDVLRLRGMLRAEDV